MNQIHPLIAKIVEDFNIDLVEYNNCYKGNCPIHNDSDSGSFTLSKNGYYYCYSHNCHKIFVDKFNRNNIIGLVRGLLSKNKQNIVPLSNVFQYFDGNINTKKYNTDDLYIINYLRKIKNKNTIIQHEPIDDAILDELEIPSPYFLTRGYSPHILNRYKVGDYKGKDYRLQSRAVIPIYHKENLIGWTARITKNKCLSCDSYHDIYEQCIRNKIDRRPKWLHSNNLQTKAHLFNLDNAHQYIINKKEIILVEGIGDALRLVESDVKNCVACYGDRLSREQINLILSIGMLNLNRVILLYDNDTAGQSVIDNISHKFPPHINIKNICLQDKKDVGEMSFNEIKELINGI